mmetsp:Transcript_6366/g.21321  ORF Transcript_6366/g.21321 Transcript_6366/m.21321 type:complete len:201 (-) Transcript_6366:6450-7052(-)
MAGCDLFGKLFGFRSPDHWIPRRDRRTRGHFGTRHRPRTRRRRRSRPRTYPRREGTGPSQARTRRRRSSAAEGHAARVDAAVVVVRTRLSCRARVVRLIAVRKETRTPRRRGRRETDSSRHPRARQADASGVVFPNRADRPEPPRFRDRYRRRTRFRRTSVRVFRRAGGVRRRRCDPRCCHHHHRPRVSTPRRGPPVWGT